MAVGSTTAEKVPSGFGSCSPGTGIKYWSNALRDADENLHATCKLPLSLASPTVSVDVLTRTRVANASSIAIYVHMLSMCTSSGMHGFLQSQVKC